jgi:hypothetical protein
MTAMDVANGVDKLYFPIALCLKSVSRSREKYRIQVDATARAVSKCGK